MNTAAKQAPKPAPLQILHDHFAWLVEHDQHTSADLLMLEVARKAISDSRNANADLIAALEDADEFVDGQVDVVDGDYGQPAPNRAMILQRTIREALAKVGRS